MSLRKKTQLEGTKAANDNIESGTSKVYITNYKMFNLINNHRIANSNRVRYIFTPIMMTENIISGVGENLKQYSYSFVVRVPSINIH